MTSFPTSNSTSFSELKHRIQALEQQVNQLLQLTQNFAEKKSHLYPQVPYNQIPNRHLESFVEKPEFEYCEHDALDSAELEELEIAYQRAEERRHYYHENPW